MEQQEYFIGNNSKRMSTPQEGILTKCAQIFFKQVVNSFIILGQATLEGMEVQENLIQTVQCQKGATGEAFQCYSHHQVKEYDLISQYLSLRPSQPYILDQQSHSNIELQENTDNKGSQTQSDHHPPVMQRNQARKTSEFHNFQKHLMTTLKKCIKMKKTANSSHSKSTIASQLWEYFFTSSKSCKREMLCLLVESFGKNGDKHQTKYRENYDKMIDYFSQYTETEIKIAQEYLRKEVVRQSYKLLQSHSFENRRINKSDDFKNYFKIFVMELQEGRLSLRLPKNTKSLWNTHNGDFDLKSQEY